MIRKISICILILCFITLPVVSSVEVIPDTIDVEIEEDQYITEQLEITNTLNYSIDVLMETDMPITFSKTFFNLGVNESIIITVFLFGEESIGYINITYDNTTENIPVTIALEESESNGDITIFPTIPNSGDLFIIALSDAVDVPGFIWINNKMYPIQIKDGFTTVELENTAYGEAQLWLYGDGFIHTFEVECGLEGNAVIGSVDAIKIDEILDVTLKIGDEPLINTGITVTDSTGVACSFKTDADGKIYPLMDKVGEWLLRAEFRGKQTVKKVTVTHQTMSVSVNKATLNIGETVIITTGEQDANIIIKKDGVSQFQTNIKYGALEYSPLSIGQYTVDVESGNKKGSTSFTVRMQTSIRILDKNNMQTAIVKQGGEYIIQVIDGNGQPVSVYQLITAEKKFNQSILLEPSLYSEPTVTIPLDNGLGFWKPEIYGIYTLSVEDSGNHIGSSIEINIEKELIVEEIDMTLVYVLTGIIIVIGIAILLFSLHKKGVITLPNLPARRKKIPDNLL